MPRPAPPATPNHPTGADRIPSDADIGRCLLALLARRDVGSSLCPSEVARALAAQPESAWRALLPRVREVAVTLARQQRVEFSQRGTRLDPQALPAGPLRLRRGPHFGSD